ncbi:hypothetical protein AC93_2683 [Escherichia coli 2-005-03_S4_C2]|nr:hypothetical protein AD23_2788 [Escherichia coli 2-005-03_S4_C3]EZJ50072.1 hypothetical protein AC93_2683 [Escherichia coli 2-005-03_S4_C2]KDT26856.1 hypothetical protein AC67_2804 [Escherichia coli 2-052-05_S4_C1]
MGYGLVILGRGVTGLKNGMDGLCSTGNGIFFVGIFFWQVRLQTQFY